MRHVAIVALMMLVSVPALAAPPRAGSCEVRVTGGVQLTFSGKGGSQAAASDHWMSRDERRQMFEKLYARAEKDPARRKAGVEQQMGPDGLMSGPLTLHCISAEGPMAASFSIFSGKNTVETIPFKPGTYTLVTLEEKPGELGVSLRLKGINYKLSAPGVLEVTRFDGRGIAGTFKFTAQTNASDNRAKAVMRNIQVSGSFDLPCLMKSRVCSK